MSLLNFNTSQSGTIHDAQFDYYGNVLASASSDASIAIWNVSQKIPQFIKLLQGHQGPVWQVFF
jgi:protein transport protein SEC13